MIADGYYLSAYLTPPGLPHLLRWWFRHDANVSLWRKSGDEVRLLRHWELERLTGVKHHGAGFLDAGEARSMLDDLVRREGIGLRDVAEVWGTPQLSTIDDQSYVDAVGGVAFHSVAHLMSALLMDTDVFFGDQALGLAVDAGPDYVLERKVKPHPYAGGVVREGALDVFPIESPGMLYLWASLRLGMLEGTLMALATASRASGRAPDARELGRFRFDDLRADAAAQEGLALVMDTVSRHPDELVGDERFTERENFVSAVMKQIQGWHSAIMERNVERILESHHLDPRETYLGLAGGSALNCPTNSELMRKYGFRGLLAPPCVNDGGLSIGVALAVFHHRMKGRRLSFRFPGAYLGDEDPELDAELERHRAFVADVSDIDLDLAVDDVAEAPVAWFDGRSESGPRALGNRSLLADPRSPSAKDRLNEAKGRQWWRPVAPVVLEEHLDAWFEDARPSPYMLETFTIRPERRDRIPAVAHLDHSARIQSLNEAQNPRLHRLLRRFHERTGVPMLCNTSLNDKREPIVNSIAEAFNFCLRRGVRVGYFSGRRVVFRNAGTYEPRAPLPRWHEPFDGGTAGTLEAAGRRLNPFALPRLYLYCYVEEPDLRGRYDIATETGARDLREALDGRFERHPDQRRDIELRLRWLRLMETRGRD